MIKNKYPLSILGTIIAKEITSRTLPKAYVTRFRQHMAWPQDSNQTIRRFVLQKKNIWIRTRATNHAVPVLTGFNFNSQHEYCFMNHAYKWKTMIVLSLACTGLFAFPAAAQKNRKIMIGFTPAPKSNCATKCNPGGLRSSKGAFRYKNITAGVKAMDELLRKKYFNNSAYNTIEKYVDQYVGPIGKRNIEEYKRNISTWSGVPRNKVIDVNDRKMRNAILAAALRQESGGDWRVYISNLFGGEEIVEANDQ